MINHREARIDVLLTAALDDLAAIKRYQTLLKLALDSDDLETVHMLIECFESYLNCQYEEAKTGIKQARDKIWSLLREIE